jgi:precorrin-6y C5,15-methyltransferase (decarboxylating) CbiE subunit
MPSITIVGCGPGSRSFASGAALEAIENAEVLIGAQRLLDEFTGSGNAIAYESVRETMQAIQDNQDKRTAVLVTGDPGLYSITSLIVKEFRFRQINIIPGISSITYAFSKLGIPWNDAVFVSAHKEQPADFSRKAAASAKLGVLTSPRYTPARLAALVEADTAATRRFYVGERLSYPDENLKEYTHQEACALEADDLSVLLITSRESE